jgi:hypothetical protein
MAIIKYRVLRVLVSGRTQYLAGDGWTHQLEVSDLMTSDEAIRRMHAAKEADARLSPPPAVVEYSVQPFSYLEPVAGPVATSASPTFDPAVAVARQLVGPLGDALRLASARGSLDALADLVRGGAPVSDEQIIAVLQ